MNDEELGRALATALAAPELQAAPYAGSRLRERGRRQRTGRLALGSAVALVLVVLAAFGAVRVTTVLSAPSTGAAANSSPVRMLHEPLHLLLGKQAQKIDWPPCDVPEPGHHTEFCTELPIMNLDEVAELQVTGREVAVRLLPNDVTMFELYTRPPQRSDLVVKLGSASYPGRYRDGTLRITAATPAGADAVVRAAGPYQPVARTGPGPLNRNRLEVLQAQSHCHDGEPGLWRLVGQCLTLSPSIVTIREADVELRRSGSTWTVRIGLTDGDRDILARWTAAHVGARLHYVLPDPTGQSGGYDINSAAVVRVPGRMTSIEIPVPDAGAGMALISRLRS